MISRRHMAYGLGAGVLGVAAGAGGFASTRRPDRALAPWGEAATFDADSRRFVFRHAILAPNPHNRQPWRIRFSGRDQAVIFCDLDRRLPETDPFDRQITIGFGCFLELARIAATERRLRLEVSLFPDGEPHPRLDGRPVAAVSLSADSALPLDPLFPAITVRRSVKRPFDLARPLPPLDTLIRHSRSDARIAASAEPALVRRVKALTWTAWMIEAETSRTWRESVDLMRIGRQEIEASPDGIALGGVMIEALALLGQVSRESIATVGTTAFKSGVDRYRDMLEATPAYAWVATPANRRADQIAAGRAYMRLALETARQGLCLHPVSQALQEFPEMAEPYKAMPAALGLGQDEHLQMLARVGYGPEVDPAPRWPMESKVERA